MALVLLALLAASLLVHLMLVRRLDGYLDPDEAVVGLMARHIHDRRSAPVFYYGQPYLGALEAWLLAPLAPARAFPAAARVLLTLTALAAGAATAAAAARASGSGAALVAAALVLFAPPDVLLWHLKMRGGFVEAMALLAATLAAAYAAIARPGDRAPALLFGLFAGLAAWTNQLTLPALAVLAIAVLATSRRGGFVLAAALLGSLPFWLENVRHPAVTFRYLLGHYSGTAGQIGANTRTLLDDTLPRLLGGPTLALATGWPWLRYLGVVLAFALLLAAMARRARPLAAALRARRCPEPADLALLALLASVPMRRNAELNQVLHWLPLLAVVLTGAAGDRGRLATRVGPALLAALAAIELAIWLPAFALDDEAVRALVARLDREGVRAVHAEHRPAYLIAFYSDERIAASPSLSYGYFVDRWPPDSARVLRDPAPGFVFEADSANERRFLAEDARAGAIEGPLAVSGYHIYRTRETPSGAGP